MRWLIRFVKYPRTLCHHKIGSITSTARLAVSAAVAVAESSWWHTGSFGLVVNQHRQS